MEKQASPTMRSSSSLSALPDYETKHSLAHTQMCRQQQHTGQLLKAPKHSSRGRDRTNPRRCKPAGPRAAPHPSRNPTLQEGYHQIAPASGSSHLTPELPDPPWGHLWDKAGVAAVPELTMCSESQFLARPRLFNLFILAEQV